MPCAPQSQKNPLADMCAFRCHCPEIKLSSISHPTCLGHPRYFQTTIKRVSDMTLTKTTSALLASAAFCCLALPAFAQETTPTVEDQGSEIEFLKAQVEAMQAQLDEIKKTSGGGKPNWKRSEEKTSELQSLMSISNADFCL